MGHGILRRRSVVVAILAVIGVMIGYLLWYGRGGTREGILAGGAQLAFVDLGDGSDSVVRIALADVNGPRTPTSLRCLRYYSAAGTSVCLAVSGPGPSYAATITDADGDVLREVPLPGVPSRARVSASGRIVSWTSFVTGDSYLMPGGFATRTGFFDVETGTLVESLETFHAEVETGPLVAIDINYWGITVAADDRTFYVTVASGGSTWLAKGDLTQRVVRAVRKGGECPSLSPDGQEIAFKRRVGRFGPWELDVLDLASGSVRSLPGTVGIDDQAEWLDGDRLAYAGVSKEARISAIFFVRADGSAPAELTIPTATSPSTVR